MTPVDTLLATVAQICKLRAAAEDALSIPARRASDVRAVGIAPYHGYAADQQKRMMAAAETIKARLVEDLTAEGHAERARVQLACAAELEAIRRDLCRQAADAAIAIGWIVRDLERDARQ